MLEQFLFFKQIKTIAFLLLILVSLESVHSALKETLTKNVILKKGEPAILSEFSYVYFLGWAIKNDNTSYEYKCGGVLVEPETYLASAHCLLQTEEMPVVVRPGILEPNSKKRTEVPIVKILVHPKYKSSSSDYDVALFKLLGHATDNPLHMWLKPDFPIEDVSIYCYSITKYGTHDFAYSEPLKGTPIVSRKDCQKYDEEGGKSGTTAVKRHEKDGYICEREPQKMRSLCLHKFGGPLLMLKLKADFEVLLGIGCGNCPSGVYTLMPKYVGWIKQTLIDFEHHFVVGGVRAQPGEFPFMAALGWKSKKNYGAIDYKCGGVLVDARYVLTAAHCFYDSNDLPTVVRARGADLEDEDVEDLEIENIIEHPDYNYPSAYNDIALVQLRNPALSVFVRIWRDEHVDFSENVTVIGYGDTKFAGSGSKELLKANLSLIPNDECKKHYDSSFFNVNEGIIDTQICAYDKLKMRDACQGDSGGPLLITMQKGEYTEPLLLGITSFGVGCASGTPGVYTRTSKYNEWIRETICEWSNLDCLFRPAKSRKPIFDNIYFLGWTSKERYGPIDYKCAGTLIHYNVAAMPAHCLYITDTMPDVVTTYGINKTASAIRVVGIERFTVHPNYTHPSLYNDIVILKLKEFVDDTPSSFWIWDEMDEPAVNDNGFVNPVFTGLATEKGILTLEPVPDDECKEYYESLDCVAVHDPDFIDDHFCVRDPTDIHNHGIVGPLMMHADDVAYNFTSSFLVGLTIMDFRCGDGSMRFYTRISPHVAWIYDTLY